MYDLIVIGGGVAGLMAAGTAAKRGLSVLLLEKMEKPARKLRITGKGRCNITNTKPLPEFSAKIRQGAEFLSSALQQFDNQQTIKFFNSIGVSTIVERGDRVFPASGSAREVAEGLVNWAKLQGVNIICNSPVVAINGGFEVITSSEKYSAKNVLITTGGVSYPATGSTGDGHQLAYDLGHQIVPLRPALVPLQISGAESLEGLALRNTKATLIIDAMEVDSRFGDVEFTDRGLAGAVILQLSRDAVDAISDGKAVQIALDLKSALSVAKLTARIHREMAVLTSATVKILLQKLLPSQLHHLVAIRSQLSLKKSVSSLSEVDIEVLCGVLKSLVFEVEDYRPFTEAIITAGGVDLVQVDNVTMQSRVVPGLYFAGEVLDIDADTGGYNIQLALSTAVLAANSIVK